MGVVGIQNGIMLMGSFNIVVTITSSVLPL